MTAEQPTQSITVTHHSHNELMRLFRLHRYGQARRRELDRRCQRLWVLYEGCKNSIVVQSEQKSM